MTVPFCPPPWITSRTRSEEHTSELQSHVNVVCRHLLEKKKQEGDNWCYNQKLHKEQEIGLRNGRHIDSVREDNSRSSSGSVYFVDKIRPSACFTLFPYTTLFRSRWLEQYLTASERTVLLVSHDRAFLSATVDHEQD